MNILYTVDMLLHWNYHSPYNVVAITMQIRPPVNFVLLICVLTEYSTQFSPAVLKILS